MADGDPEQQPAAAEDPPAPAGDAAAAAVAAPAGGAARTAAAAAKHEVNFQEAEDPAGDGGEDTQAEAMDGQDGPNAPPRKPRRPPAKPSASREPSLAALSQSMGSLFNGKTPTTMDSLSNFNRGPAVTMGARVASGSFIRSNSNPGPGSYNLSKGSDGHARYSFGGQARFGLEPNPSKEKPGPGQYGIPRDPGLERGPRVAFSGAPRADLVSKREAPGPGAYELKTCMGEGKMFTAAGRHYGSTVRSRMMPGPGAYDPSDRLDGRFSSSMKVGFGTSTREDFAIKREASKPGPGAYEIASKKAIGSDASKFSIRSRRKMHDLSAYIEPGPGHYASHSSSFGALRQTC